MEFSGISSLDGVESGELDLCVNSQPARFCLIENAANSSGAKNEYD